MWWKSFSEQKGTRTAGVYLSISVLECGILLVHLKVDLSSGDGQSSSSHHHWSYQLSWSAQNHWA